jgi:DNA-binding response OmpR family regulator
MRCARALHAMAERILLIEDDTELGAQLVAWLSRAGYLVSWWQEGRRRCSPAPNTR